MEKQKKQKNYKRKKYHKRNKYQKRKLVIKFRVSLQKIMIIKNWKLIKIRIMYLTINKFIL